MASPWDAFFGPARGAPARGPHYDLPRAYVGDALDDVDDDDEYGHSGGMYVRPYHGARLYARSAYPPGGQNFSYYELESVVCDLMLAGWVFLRSAVWQDLLRDCQELIFRRLVKLEVVRHQLVRVPSMEQLDAGLLDDYDEYAWLDEEPSYERVRIEHRLAASPKAMVQWGYEPDLNYKRYIPLGIQGRFGFNRVVHGQPRFGIYLRRDREQEREERVLWALGPYGPIYGPPATRPPRHELGPRDPRGPTRDEYNRDAKGRVIHVKEHCKKKPKPNNVAWQKGRHTGRRCKGR
jgi:hypothetical protein